MVANLLKRVTVFQRNALFFSLCSTFVQTLKFHTRIVYIQKFQLKDFAFSAHAVQEIDREVAVCSYRLNGTTSLR